ncbi:DUF5808 domain-containing protein [Actinoallomurus sp. NPDC050550]|uniref:DUF1648 domain-containing protein n=1 Tax=Actinoallomurus sp. NPDC050550 TaxID=3154937 RepID=UPI0033E710EE
MTGVTLFPVLLIGVVHWLIPSLVPPTLPFGVRVPLDRAHAPVIDAWRRRYRVGTAGATAAAAVAVVLLRAPLAGPIAVGALLAVGLVLYLAAHRAIREAKTSEGWFAGRRQVTVVDTSLRTDPERYPWRWAVPSLLLAAATPVIGIVEYPRMPHRLPTHVTMSGHPDHFADKSIGTVFAPVVTQVLVTALVAVLAWAVLRSRARLDAEDPQAATRHRRFVSAMARAMLVMGACLNLTFLLVALPIWHLVEAAPVVAVGVPTATALGVAVMLAVVVRTGQGGSRLRLGPARTGLPGAGRRPAPVNQDDDRFYRWGLVYYNRDDPALFVPKRFGVGWTLNMARPLSWVMLGATLVLIAVGPLVGALAR